VTLGCLAMEYTMTHAAYIDAVDQNCRAAQAAIDQGPLDARVPTCAEWAVSDLVEHVTGVLGFWSHVLCEGTGRPKPDVSDFPKAAEAIVTELRATSPDTTVWSWLPGHENAGFVARRMAHEMAIHRVDAQAARHTVQPIDAELAADGLEEMFSFAAVASDRVADGHPTEPKTLHLHCAEGHEWFVELKPDGVVIDRRHAPADLALRGAVSDMELLLYSRPTVGPVERLGDQDVLDAWYRAFTFG
jgi:uncharacterized protein (TIGR03083 family)